LRLAKAKESQEFKGFTLLADGKHSDSREAVREFAEEAAIWKVDAR
jgi:hypothetical protein